MEKLKGIGEGGESVGGGDRWKSDKSWRQNRTALFYLVGNDAALLPFPFG